MELPDRVPHLPVDREPGNQGTIEMNVLFLDDNQSRTKTFRSQVPSAVCVDTADDCVKALMAEDRWDYVFLDHDLGGEEMVDSFNNNTGAWVARWLSKNHRDIGLIVIHTLNPAGATAMRDTLLAAEYDVELIPFAWTTAGTFIEQ